jgi:predicted Zn-dependent protease
LAAIRLGTDLYRVIFATRTLDEETDQRFVAAIESFRRLPSDEVPRLKPLHLSMVTASETDTPATMTGRMAVTDRPLEYFLLLNGMDRAGPLRAGQRYKVITE